jgi:tRNA threonylcarbamoyladenosine biosynthesis protein TsaE
MAGEAVPAPGVFTVRTHGRAETQAVGEALAQCIAAGQVIALRGNLGAGKTTFVQGLARGLQVHDRVSSPTFVLVNEYTSAGGVRLLHVDTYRLGTAPGVEAALFGLEEMLDDGDAIVAIEWADRVTNLLPPDHLLVDLGYGEIGDDRIVCITARGAVSAAALACLRRMNSARSTA